MMAPVDSTDSADSANRSGDASREHAGSHVPHPARHHAGASAPAASASPSLALPPGMKLLERGWLSANNIVFLEGDEATVVDTGYVTHAAQTLALVEHALDGRRLTRLINTHLHSDHCGGNAALQSRWAPRTWIPAAQAQAVAAWDANALTFEATGQQCERFAFDEVLRDGDRLMLGGQAWEVVAAPGHDDHAVMLFAPGPGILISGDALWENGFGVIFPELAGESGFAEQEAVLARIASLAPRLVIPGHGRAFTGVDAALRIAAGRLAHLRADPRRNAQHAVKVLVKFKLLEQQAMSHAALLDWMSHASLMAVMDERHFGGAGASAMLDEALAGLVKAGAAARQGDLLRNRD